MAYFRSRFSLTARLGCLVVMLIPGFFANAQTPPDYINFQGYLTNTAGSPVNIPVDMTVRLWSDEVSVDNGDFMYFEEHLGVQVDSGLFNLLVGLGVIDQGNDPFSADIFNEPEIWLELEIDGEVLAPRRRLAPVPYAFRARIGPASVGSIEIVNNSVSTQDIQDQTITASDVALSSLTGNQILNGSVSGSDIADNSLTGADVQTGSLNGSDIADESLTGADIDDNSLTGADIANGSLTSADLADAAGADFASTSSNVSISPGTTNLQLLTVTINAPAAGKVLANAAGSFFGTDGDTIACEIHTGTTITIGRWLAFSGSSYALTRGFDVSAGSTTFRLICNTSGFNTDNVTFANRYLTAIYVPTSL